MAVYEGLQKGDLGDLGHICEWPRERVEAGDWSPAVFFDPELAHACHDIERLGDGSGRFARLGDLYEINTTNQILGSGKWAVFDADNGNRLPVAYGSGEAAQTTLAGHVDKWVQSIASKSTKRDSDNLWSKRGRLLIANSLDTSSGRLHAVVFRSPVVGRRWTPIQSVSATDAQALAVWCNSTLGRVLFRKYGSRRANWPVYAPAAIKQLVVPDTTAKRWSRVREPLLDAYHATKTRIVPQFRVPDVEVRQVWDRAVAKTAGIPMRTMNRWRKLMETEPFVSGGR